MRIKLDFGEEINNLINNHDLGLRIIEGQKRKDKKNENYIFSSGALKGRKISTISNPEELEYLKKLLYNITKNKTKKELESRMICALKHHLKKHNVI